MGTDAGSVRLQWKIYHPFAIDVEFPVWLPKEWVLWRSRRIVKRKPAPLRLVGRRTGEMIHAGIAEYGAILTALSGFSLSGMEPTTTVILIAVGVVFLFWLVVFKL